MMRAAERLHKFHLTNSLHPDTARRLQQNFFGHLIERSRLNGHHQVLDTETF